MKMISAMERLVRLSKDALKIEQDQPGPFAMRHLHPDGWYDAEMIRENHAIAQERAISNIMEEVVELQSKFTHEQWDRIVDEVYSNGYVPHAAVRQAMEAS